MPTKTLIRLAAVLATAAIAAPIAQATDHNTGCGVPNQTTDSYIAERALTYTKGFLDGSFLGRASGRNHVGAMTGGTKLSRTAADRAAYHELAKIDPTRITERMQSTHTPLLPPHGTPATSRDGFDWNDAAAGFGAATLAAIVVAAVTVATRKRRTLVRPRPPSTPQRGTGAGE